MAIDALSTPQAFKALWFNSQNPGGPNNTQTMENYFKTCSYGKTRLSDVSYGSFGSTPVN